MSEFSPPEQFVFECLWIADIWKQYALLFDKIGILRLDTIMKDYEVRVFRKSRNLPEDGFAIYDLNLLSELARLREKGVVYEPVREPEEQTHLQDNVEQAQTIDLLKKQYQDTARNLIPTMIDLSKEEVSSVSHRQFR